MLIETDTGQTATKIQGYVSSSNLTVKEIKPSLSASIYTEYISQMYSVCDGHINWIRVAGEQGKKFFNAFDRCWVFFKSTYRINSLCTHKIKVLALYMITNISKAKDPFLYH